MAQSAATPAAPPDGSKAPAWIASPEITPGTVVLTALDPSTMTPSEVQFGVAPKRSPNVDYAPDAIVMEQGDKAIKSVASDGITWTFDANAPQVSDFQVGKIVFATGRAVGRVLALKPNGSTVTAILGPIQITDVVTRGRFVVNLAVDPSKIISYVAPDYPGVNDTTKPLYSANLDGAARDAGTTVIVSTLSHGAWVPASMSQGGAMRARLVHGRGLRSSRAKENLPSAGLDFAATSSRQLPGMPQGLPRVPPTPTPFPAGPKLAGQVPEVFANAGNVRIDPVTSNSGVGVNYYFVPKNSDMGAFAGGLVSLEKPVVKAVFVITGAHWDSAGISIVGAAGIRLLMDAHSATDKVINFHLQHFVPIDFSIPLGGPLPLSLTFATFFNINSGFSAKSSIMSSEGDYHFSGTVWAGYAGGWKIDAPTNFTTTKTLGGTAASLSLGINSADLAFGIRSMVGIGAFGFNTGVFATTRFGGSIVMAPNEAMACRRGTLSAYMDSGLGYQIPGFAEAAINFFLTPITGKSLDQSKPLWSGPSKLMFEEDVSYPTGCAGKSG